MIPAPNVKLALNAWQRMEKASCHPCGVMVYPGGEYEAIANYMCAEGMETVDGLFRAQAGDACAVIATDVPSSTWRTYARYGDLLWWRWYGESMTQAEQGRTPTVSLPGGDPNDDAPAVAPDTDEAIVSAIKQELLAYPDDKIVASSDEAVPLGMFQDSDGWMWYFREPFPIATTFRINPLEVPCLKVRGSFQERYGWQFPLNELTREQMITNFQEIVSHARFPVGVPH